MQITINTNDILGDETTLREEIIDRVVSSITLWMQKEFTTKISQSIETQLQSIIGDKVAEIVAMQVDTEITEVDRYGKTLATTTIRNNIANKLETLCQFKQTTYSSEQNPFTKIVIKTVEEEMTKFKKDYMSLVNAKLVQECLDEATKKLKAACGIK